MDEVGRVVPDVDLLADPAPVLQVALVVGVLLGPAVGNRGRIVAGDRRNGDHHVLFAADARRRRLAPAVGVRVDEDAGVLLADDAGHLVDEVDHHPGVGPVLLDQGLAVVAGAEVTVVGLAEGDQPPGGVLVEFLDSVLGGLPGRLHVRQADVVFLTAASSQSEPLRMVGHVLRGRQVVDHPVGDGRVHVDRAEVVGHFVERRMHPVAGAPQTGLAPQRFGFRGGVRTVAAHPQVAVQHVAVLQDRRPLHIHVRQSDRLHVGNRALARRPPPATQPAEHFIDTVHRAALRPADNHQPVADRLDQESVLAELGGIDLHTEGFHCGRVADQNGLLREVGRFGLDLQFSAAHLLEVRGQVAGGKLLARAGLL